MSSLRKIILDSSALRHNLNCVREYAPHSKVLAMLKANAYGHGLLFAAQTLAAADAVGLASIEEGLYLRHAGVRIPIVLMQGFYDQDSLQIAVQENFACVIHHVSQLHALAALPENSINVWLKIDTGMHRLGFAPQEFSTVWQALQNCKAVRKPICVMTHFACASDPTNPLTNQQINFFEQLNIADIQGVECSLANSAGIVAYPAAHADWVRPGIMLYGSSPLDNVSAAELNLKPVMTLKSHLIAVHDFPEGAAIGYGQTFICPKPMRIGVVAFGYGDGYPRHASTGTPVLWRNQRLALIGRVSMDMITVDLSECPEAQCGDEVTLWGEGLSADEVALSADTIAYELFCKVQRHRLEEIVC